MDEVIKMYAMNDGNPDLEPAELSADHDELEEDDEVETSTVHTSSDDDEGIVEIYVAAERPTDAVYLASALVDRCSGSVVVSVDDDAVRRVGGVPSSDSP